MEISEEKDEDEEDEKKDEAEEKKEEDKQAKEFKELMSKFKMKQDEQEDTQAFIALQAGWETNIGDVTILGKITRDWGMS